MVRRTDAQVHREVSWGQAIFVILVTTTTAAMLPSTSYAAQPAWLPSCPRLEMHPIDQLFAQFACEFFSSTVGVDMAPSRQRLIEQLHTVFGGEGVHAAAFEQNGMRQCLFKLGQ